MQADFYILEADDPQARLNVACRLVQKAHLSDRPVFIHTQSQQDAQRLDELLWTFQDESFIPHQILGTQAQPCPIQIGVNDEPTGEQEILINLGDCIPNCYTQFERIIEIIPSDPTSKTQGRERYTFYKEKDWELNTHSL